MKNKILAVAALLLAGTAFAVSESIDKFNNPRPVQFASGIYVGSDASLVAANVKNKLTRVLGTTTTIDFTTQTVGRQESSAVTVTGARTGDRCIVTPNATAAALAAQFTCYVSATNAVKVVFVPLSEQIGTTAALDGASPSVATATVTASSVCTASVVGTAAGTAVQVSVTSTTLTVTGANSATNTVNYRCNAPVDPASGEYTITVLSMQ